MASPISLCDFLDQIACRLNDNETGYEFTRWSREFIVKALNTALKVLRAERPDLFIELTEYTLTPGCAQQLVPDGCEFHSIAYTDLSCEDAATTTPTGTCATSPTVSVAPTELDDNLSRIAAALDSRSCSSLSQDVNGNVDDTPYQVQAWEFSTETGGNYFTVSPVPPAGTTTVVFINCIGQAPCYTVPTTCPETTNEQSVFPTASNSKLCHYIPFLEEYILYIALSRDDTSNLQDSKAQAHLNTAMALIGRTKVADYLQHRDNMHLVGPTDEDRDNFTIMPRGGL